MISARSLSTWIFSVIIAATVTALPFLFLVALTMMFVDPPRHANAARSIDGSNLRQIGQASLIHASDHRDRLPRSDNIRDYAAELARHGGLNDASIWISAERPSSDRRHLTTVVDNEIAGRPLNPTFRNLQLDYAVPLGELHTGLPGTTPIAWTAGLRPDGTWSTASAYQGKGGHIVFLAGNVAFYRDLALDGGQLQRFDGGGKTANILEALPPGTRIGESHPLEDAGSYREPLGPRLVALVLPPLRTALQLAWLPWWLAVIALLSRRIYYKDPHRRRSPRALVRAVWIVPFALLALSVLVAVASD